MRQRKVLAKALKTASDPVLVRSAFELPAEQRAAIQMRSTKPSRLKSGQFRDRARPDQRHRAHHEWTKGGVEHRGVSGVAGKGVGELLKEKDKPEAKTEPKPKSGAEPAAPEEAQ
jgi:F-type H+-transporting ATPase subunit b